MDDQEKTHIIAALKGAHRDLTNVERTLTGYLAGELAQVKHKWQKEGVMEARQILSVLHNANHDLGVLLNNRLR
jgi:hypothetical protein